MKSGQKIQDLAQNIANTLQDCAGDRDEMLDELLWETVSENGMSGQEFEALTDALFDLGVLEN